MQGIRLLYLGASCEPDSLDFHGLARDDGCECTADDTFSAEPYKRRVWVRAVLAFNLINIGLNCQLLESTWAEKTSVACVYSHL